MRDLTTLPKANLHLHLTGSMRPTTLAELAARYDQPVPAPRLVGAGHDWSAFQSRYDAARSVLRTAGDIARVITEAVAADLADGAHWVELQVDPTSYAGQLGSLEAVAETLLAAAGPRAGIVLSGSWAAPPELAVRVARLAARFAGAGIVACGLSNDERRGRVADFVPAFRIVADAGLLAVPHGGFYEPASQVRDCVELLQAQRIGHGLTAATDPATVELLARRGVALELCPTSYPPLGVAELADLPIRALRDAGVPVALGSDDPLLFGAGLAEQYALVRGHLGFTDAELAGLARDSIVASAAPAAIRTAALAGIDDWLAAPDPTGGRLAG
jgi:adenosine deaminase